MRNNAMKRGVFKKSSWDIIRSGVTPLLFTAIVLVLISFGLRQVEISGKSEGKRILEESIYRAVAKCYALEGHYPDTITYIEDHYSIHIDRTKYVVHYEIFASNILPDISVIEL